MKLFWTLLLALAFSHAALAAVMPLHGCCQSPECDMVQCAQFGCLPAALPMASSAASSVSPVMPATDYAPATAPEVQFVLHEIWTPPD